MKRVRKSEEVPERLARYVQRCPTDTWDHFHHRDRLGYRQVKQQIIEDQYGLCAYCEISIRLSGNEEEVDDFRVEHFHPKSGTECSRHNYHLDWYNMLGVCHGGSQPYGVEARYRYTRNPAEHSCDVPKSGKHISGAILNPLEIPAETRLFKYDSFTGAMEVDEGTCPRRLQHKARRTIEELNLNCNRLKRLRKAAIEVLEEQVDAMVGEGMAMEDAMAILARQMLDPGDNHRYAAFFTCIRWFLGDAAEAFLRERHYQV